MTGSELPRFTQRLFAPLGRPLLPATVFTELARFTRCFFRTGDRPLRPENTFTELPDRLKVCNGPANKTTKAS